MLSGESRVIRDRKTQPKELDDGPEEPLGLTERNAEDHADRQCSFNGQVRIGALTSWGATGKSTPGMESDIRPTLSDSKRPENLGGWSFRGAQEESIPSLVTDNQGREEESLSLAQGPSA